MFPKSYLAIVVFFLLFSLYRFPVTDAQSNLTALTVTIPGEQQRIISDNPVLVAGIWHYINITLNQSVSLVSLVFYKGAIPPVIRNETNFYEWEYNDAVSANWDDKLYGVYIRNTNCSQINNFYSFYIGIDQVAAAGNWTIDIIVDNIEIHKTTIFVEQKIFSPGISYPEDFGLQAEPFTEINISSEPNDLYLSLENNGNIPLNVSVSYSQYQNRVTLTNLENILHPFSKTRSYVTVNTGNTWRSGKIFVEASVTLTGQYLILTGTVVLPEKLEETFNIPILIGHSNYELFESATSDITFQYEEQLTVEYDEIKNLIAYIGGSGDVNITVYPPQNATLLKVTHNDEVITQMPFLVHSTNASEQAIVTQIHFTQEDTTALITYKLEIDGEQQSFTTKINVGSQQLKEEESPDNTLIMIIIGICIITVIGYMIYNQIKYRRK
jgi:hypothetical protein